MMSERSPKNPDGYLIMEEYEVFDGAKKLFTISLNGVNIIARKTVMQEMATVYRTQSEADAGAEAEKARLENEGKKEVSFQVNKVKDDDFRVVTTHIELDGGQVKAAIAGRIAEEVAAKAEKEKQEAEPFVSPVESQFSLDVQAAKEVVGP